ncbi:ATP-dependent DNA helicase RecQ [Methanosarcina horonobensis HB-1 = JCM 15518]|uniref:DNA 3'-5' helicase n=1 Tax=Methanosarcina horonobensis HB-1 = JCM 15518 TaxID=1434110 RepID=A0A0E3SAA8_9EURY|nr:DNA helicase RecQ [Methanosarcina horonobensis]AKB76597.1 ATP-dependent DNA helicase RecQ [Methanosarcina horonobensis HB-1 = JCM 15518]
MGTGYGALKDSKSELESRVLVSARMHSVLHQYFGYTAFRPLQEEIIRDVLDRKDVFVLMPTGGGKSICYQLPSLLLDGVTVVVSPLISLMKDQVDGLEANGIAAACMNSTQSAREIRDIKTAFLENRLKVLYIAPERLMMPGTFAFLKKGKVSLFAIDEAHCISEWGHDFRPEYRKLKLLRDSKTGFPDVPVIALTATATNRVRKDIITQLGLDIDPEKGPYVASFNRSNLYYEVRPKKDTFSEITDYLLRHRGEAGIIYCQSRNNVETLTRKLNLAGFRALPYHAGLSDSERSRNQEMFIKDDVDIIVATIAFGMGINKSNVRFVIHYDLPRNLESYYQETGRGGRDGSPCECILFFSRGDRFKIEYFIAQKTNEKEKDISLVQLRQMVAYCEGNKCRRQTLMEYFGEELSTQCGNCDTCLRPKNTFDGTEAARKLISCIQELNQRFGTNYIIDVLTGSKNKKIKQNRHEKLKAHGSGKEFSKEQWRSLASEMLNTGFLEVSGAQYPVLKLNAMSRKILNGSERIELVCPEGFIPGAEESFTLPAPAGKSPGKAENDVQTPACEHSTVTDILKKEKSGGLPKSGTEHDPILFERLKALRKQIALNKNLPPYIIFSDTSLKEMAAKLPRTPEEFHSITGVGDHKLRKYGDDFLKEIRDYCKDYDLMPVAEVEVGIESTSQEADKKKPLAASSSVTFPEKLSGAHSLPAKKIRYLDMSIQDWSEADSSDSFNSTGLERNSPELTVGVSEIDLPEDDSQSCSLEADFFETGSFKTDSFKKDPEEIEFSEVSSLNSDIFEEFSLEKTYSLYVQGLNIGEIAEIEGLPVKDVYRQFEKLILDRKVSKIEGLVPPERYKQISAAMEVLETEIDYLLRAKLGEGCQEDELKLVKALLLSKLLFSA